MAPRLSGSDNPALIHFYETSTSTSASRYGDIPLFLIHDGGGTTFSYHCLDPLGRTTYGIHNVYFDEGGFWQGGIPEMAAHYVSLIEQTLPEGGDILLGGWSLGGILSLAMSHLIANTPEGEIRTKKKLRVLGMVWVDSVYPQHVEGERSSTYVGPNERIVKPEAELAAMNNKELVQLNMTHARRMVFPWDMPQWGKEVTTTTTTTTTATTTSARHGESNGAAAMKPPPTILLRAKENGQGEKELFVDRTRHFRMLGWEKYNAAHGEFIYKIVDVEGGHFTVFAFDKIARISKQIQTAADELVERARSGTA